MSLTGVAHHGLVRVHRARVAVDNISLLGVHFTPLGILRKFQLYRTLCDVCLGPIENLQRVLELPKRRVASVTEESSDGSGDVIVVNRKPLALVGRSIANRASLPLNLAKFLIQIGGSVMHVRGVFSRIVRAHAGVTSASGLEHGNLPVIWPITSPPTLLPVSAVAIPSRGASVAPALVI